MYSAFRFGQCGFVASLLHSCNFNFPVTIGILGLLFSLLPTCMRGAVHYVDVGSATPAPPYTSWATAATRIQDAVDVAVSGDEVLVTNGVYTSGGVAISGLMTNRVAVTNALYVHSVNGPQATVIQGRQLPGTILGDGAIRCAYLASNAILAGFTLTNGATRAAGDYTTEVSGGGVWCADYSVVVSNCVLTGNIAAGDGGGAYLGNLSGCTLAGNSAGIGGGAESSVLINCTLRGNSASGGGGGGDNCRLTNCRVTENSSLGPGSANSGGGVDYSSLTNCTVTGNRARAGGGAFSSTLVNCIVYFNTAAQGENYDSSCTLIFCCATPLYPGGGNIGVDPLLASASHLSEVSPCRGAGNLSFVSGLDIDGESWASPPAMGCDEIHVGAISGPLTVGFLASSTNVALGYQVSLTALIEGRTTSSAWDFGDGSAATNKPFIAHSWTSPGDYIVSLRGYNESFPSGIPATVTIHVVSQPVHYVDSGNNNPLAPFNSWATAATNIQDAVDAATVPGALILVTNGLYASGARQLFGVMTNRVAVTKPLIVKSVNGPQVTLIQGQQAPGSTNNGDGAIRCVYLANGAVIAGFTLTNGASRASGDDIYEQSGGAAFCEGASAVMSNCIVVGSTATWGGGVSQGTMYDCTLGRNWSSQAGGGAFQCGIIGCLLTNNSSGYLGGGSAYSTLSNCIVNANVCGDEGGGTYSSALDKCVLFGNLASGGFFAYGGGASSSTLNNCLVASNTASSFYTYGGGAYNSTLNNCTVAGNFAGFGGRPMTPYGTGGGVSGGTINNCIVYFNTAYGGADNYDQAAINHSCTTPIPPSGGGNISSDPFFVALAAGDFRLQSTSPCINSGRNAFVGSTTDLDGNPRIHSGTVDMGAYEYQGPGSVISYAWLQQYGLPTDGSADYADSDGDGMNNWQEWRCQTIPTNAQSVLKMISALPMNNNVVISWQSVAGVNYFIERSTNLLAVPPFVGVATNITGLAGTTSYSDVRAPGAGVLFYRVGVGN
jgi:parallel beta-helix repeat protein